jgi:phage-related protein
MHEIRSTLPSRKISRIIFFVYENQIILLHGFIKKTQKTDSSDLRLAKKRKNEVINYE